MIRRRKGRGRRFFWRVEDKRIKALEKADSESSEYVTDDDMFIPLEEDGEQKPFIFFCSVTVI